MTRADRVRLHERLWMGARLLGWLLIVVALAWRVADAWRRSAPRTEVLMGLVQAVGTALVAVGFERHARWARARAREEASRTPPRP